MNNADAMSRLVIPVAASSATRCSVGDSCAAADRLTLVRANSWRTRSTHSCAPMASKQTNASASVADAASLAFCRRCS